MTSLIEDAPCSGATGDALPETLHLFGNLLTFPLRGADTGMAFSMADCRTAPGAGSPPHLQTDTESFVVLEGSYEFQVGDAVLARGPGTITTVPSGVPHAFRNPGVAPARMLILAWPADAHERFFRAAGDPVAAGTSDFPPIAAPDMPRRHCQVNSPCPDQGHLSPLRCQFGGSVVPQPRGISPGVAAGGWGKTVAFWMKEGGCLILDGQKPLGLTRGFETAHNLLSSSRVSVRCLGAVV